MFHKENSTVLAASACSSVAAGNGNSASSTRPSSKGNKPNNNKKNTKDSTPKQKFLKDVPLRKSDKRRLRDLAEAVLFGRTIGPSNAGAEEEEAGDEDASSLREEEFSSFSASSSSASVLLHDIFLNGMIVSRTVLLSDRIISGTGAPAGLTFSKAILYYKAPSNTTAASSSSSSSSTNTDNTSLTSWPYTQHSQCIWMQVHASVDRNSNSTSASFAVFELPSLALLSVLNPATTQLLLPRVWVGAQVSNFLCRGAHVMRAGIIRNDVMTASDATRGTSSIAQDEPAMSVVAVHVIGNPQAIAVGLFHPPPPTPTSCISNSANTGRGVTVCNCYGDDFWRQQQHPSSSSFLQKSATGAVAVAVVSPWGGAPYDDGHYGNVGFVDGTYVAPILVASAVKDIGKEETDQQGNDDKAIHAIHDDDDDNDDGEAFVESNKLEADEQIQNDDETVGGGGGGVIEGQFTPGIVPNFTTGEDTAPTISSEKAPVVEGGGEEEDVPPIVSEQAASQFDSTPPSPEHVFHEAVCRSLAQLQPKKQYLPMTVATFYAKHVLLQQNQHPVDTIPGIKATRWKKLHVYLAEQVKAGLITVGPDPAATLSSRKKNQAIKADPMAMLLDYNRQHADLRSFLLSATMSGHAAVEEANAKLVVLDLFCVPHHFQNLLRLDPDAVKAVNATSEERRNTGMLTMQEMRNILDSYTSQNDLVDVMRPSHVNLDGPLTDALFSKPKKNATPGAATIAHEAPPMSLSRQDLFVAWTNKMESAYAIVQVPGNRVLRLGRGKPPTVTLEVTRRQSRKYVTRVSGMQDFGITATELAQQVSHRFACSATVENNTSTAIMSNTAHVVVQGNLAEELQALLLGDERLTGHGGAKASPYRLPKKAVQVILRKGVPGQKKVG